MKHIAYKALDDKRNIVEGETDIEDDQALNKYFLERRLMPLNVTEKKVGTSGPWLQRLQNWWQHKLFQTELIMFTRQFAAAYGAGLGVAKAIDILSAQTTHQNFKKALEGVSTSIKNGKGLVESFAAFPWFFDATYRAMLVSGEISGNLDTVLNYVANLLEKKHAHQERISSTLLYPKLVLGAITITIIVVLIFVVPTFQKIFDKFEAELPMPTQILMGASDIFLKWWWTLVIVVPAGIFAIEKLKKNDAFMLWFHETVLSVPLFGPLFLKIELTHFTTTFTLLLRAGIRVTEATQISVNAMNNTYLKMQLQTIIPAIEGGGTFSGALKKVKVIPALMVSMVTMGEESGTLDQLLDRVAALYDSEAEQMVKKLPTLLEPVILAFLFCMVLFLALAVYLPMWKMASLIKK